MPELITSAKTPPEKVASAEELRAAVARAEGAYDQPWPLIFELRAHGRKALFGAGVGVSFVQVSAPGQEPPYTVVKGEGDPGLGFDFYHLGLDLHSVPGKYLVGQPRALDILGTFLETGELDPGVEWEIA